MADLNDFKNKNTKFTGTIGERVSTGTTGERDEATYGQGTIRFNTSTALLEYYTGTEWKSVDAPPTITNFTIDGGSPVTNSFFATDSSVKTVVINGSLFDTLNASVLFVGTGGGDVSPLTTTRNSSNLLTITVNSNSFSNSFEPYDLRVINGSGLFATLENAIVSDTSPTFTTSAGTLGTIFDSLRSSYSLSSAAATDADGDTITYSVSIGALPAGLSLNSSTGAITGTASAVVSNTTSTFTISAATSTQTSTRQFSITVNAPVVDTFTSGSGTFNVPSGITSVNVLVVAGGGTGGPGQGGGAGAGGLIFRPGFPVTPGGTVSYAVGAGNPSSNSIYPNPGGIGQGQIGGRGFNSTFGPLTAIGGGDGHGDDQPGTPGGSGGAASDNAASVGGTGVQPQQPGDSGTYGFGNPGGNGGSMDADAGAGGGGAGGGGEPAQGKQGGAGRTYTISGSSVTYAGGGRGGWGPARRAMSNSDNPGGGGGAGEGGQTGRPGVANRGGGGGGGGQATGSGGGGSGGPGVIIIQY